MLIVLLALGCQTPEPTEPGRSTPMTATVDLQEGEDQKPVFPDATSAWFEAGTVQLPPPLRTLVPGMPADDAVEVFYGQLRAPPKIRNMDGATIGSGMVKGLDDVSLTIITRADSLLEIQVGLHTDLALALLTNRWGDPNIADRTKLPHAEFHWTKHVNDDMLWLVTLHKVDNERTLVRYHIDEESLPKPKVGEGE